MEVCSREYFSVRQKPGDVINDIQFLLVLVSKSWYSRDGDEQSDKGFQGSGEISLRFR
jgi:hypothetical protein